MTTKPTTTTRAKSLIGRDCGIYWLSSPGFSFLLEAALQLLQLLSAEVTQMNAPIGLRPC